MKSNPPADKRQRLADAVRGCFEDGLAIDGCARQYIDTCLPDMGMAELAHRIGHGPDGDIAPLMDLIFFPDEALQLRLEPLLETEPFDGGDEAAVVAMLKANAIRTALKTTECPGGIPLQVPPSVLEPFIRRLGIRRRIPPHLSATLDDTFSPSAATRLKVMLRNTRIALTGPFADFLEAFLLGIDPKAENIGPCFRTLLGLLGEKTGETDPFRLLREKTDTYYRARDAARRFQEQLARSNMETLMHLGMRAPEIGIETAEEKLALLDRIGRAVALGRCKVRRREKGLSAVKGEFESEKGPFTLG